ncbi:response regulator receiver domain protein [Shewanella violacea DSS12]|uniref:Response regulator receiver domain protein n=1 Tax=Shewanella violacea (strain JCM 10179 / CIP 106290 / LMG 19151 / DSS12) TaxID=637905 RepID=D4ZMC4_SHEVD|nr:response regulator receiver domain protein [Shewanella violacea DSS12]
MIADDDPISRRVNKDIFSSFGFDVDLVVNGREAIERFKTSIQENVPYALICLDMVMPFFDGTYALNEIRHIEANANDTDKAPIPIAMMTSKEGKRNRSSILSKRSLCHAYLFKPLSIDVIDELLIKLKLQEQT